MICNTGVTTVEIPSLSDLDRKEGKADNDDEPSPTRGEKQAKSSAPLSSVEPAPTSPGGHDVGVVFNIGGKRESLLKASSARSKNLPNRAKYPWNCST
jgi:hypothetical protein